jgi:ubiquinone/menaquinone biosynthesis C-methylase UbiE
LKPYYPKNKKRDTSWQGVAKWYKKAVGEKGLYFHTSVIFPKGLKLLELAPGDSLLDLACGEGVLSRQIPKNVYYQGVDLANDLINFAKKDNPSARFEFGDITQPLKVDKKDFTHASIILALQNIEDYDSVFQNAAKHLRPDGRFLIVLNHPYFRIPRQTSWGIDESKKIQYRRLDRYYSPLKIPINMTPGSTEQKNTWSFHFPLETYIRSLVDNGFVIEAVEEWLSDKNSVGKAAKMENRARDEFPMFMAIVARKC